ncbi:MAG: helix-turn-helix domain-containing protein [Micrococcales bacterium]|nr:helix-turn-helix domain-containing protein [Micrococcales bacterium]
MKSDQSHQTLGVAAEGGPPGLHPPPKLDWEVWRSHVKGLKAAKGLSINELAGRSGLDRSTIIELLGGRRGVADVRIGTLWALAWALDVDDFAEFLAPLFENEGLKSTCKPGKRH